MEAPGTVGRSAGNLVARMATADQPRACLQRGDTVAVDIAQGSSGQASHDVD